MPKVLVICELASWLDEPQAARAVADAVLDRAPQQTTGQLRAKLRQLVLAVDPQAARRRCARAIRTRRVETFANPDGTGELSRRGSRLQAELGGTARQRAITGGGATARDRSRP